MATYTALVACLRNIGTAGQFITQDGALPWIDTDTKCLTRIRSITNPHVVMDAIGGFISADFVVPPEEAMIAFPYLRKNANVWMFDGQTPVFYGLLDAATTQNDSSVLVTVNGYWQVAAMSRMREVWDDWDMTRLKTAPNNMRNGNVATDSDSSMTISFPKGTVAVANDKVSVDYFLFNESTGSRDNKLITGFELDISSASYGGNFEFDVFGKPSPGSASSDTLLSTTATSGTFKRGAVANSWSAAGYRCLRFTVYCTSNTTTSADRFVTLDRVRVTTREGLFQSYSNAGVDTGKIARDVFNQKAEVLDRFDIVPEFWRQENNDGSFIYGSSGAFADGSGAGDPVTGTGTCKNSGVTVTGFNVVDWTAPTEILTELAQMDGSHVGFYFPINTRSGYFFGGASDTPGPGGNYTCQWVAAPPQLVYKPWSDLTSPDYSVSMQEGAEVEPDSNEQPLINSEYVNYQTLSGYQASVITEGQLSNPDYAAYFDWLTANGYRRAEDYSIQPSIGAADGSNASTAASIGKQLIQLRNQPTAAGKITIRNDGTSRYPILAGNGARIPKLALVRPGVFRVVDLPHTKRWAVGRGTHVEWWGQTLDSPEHVEITLGQPGQLRLDRRLAQLQWRSDHTFIKKK